MREKEREREIKGEKGKAKKLIQMNTWYQHK